MKSVIELQNVCKTYLMGDTEVKAACGVNLKVAKGEYVSIVGPSGCGKSTLLDLIGVLNRPTSGKVLIDGRDTSDIDDSELALIRGQKIGFVFQSFNLISRLNALENVMLPMWFAGMGKEKRYERGEKLLKLIGLGDRMEHTPNQLSGGQRQRVAIARALANNPPIIVADEPTGNLDSKSGKEVVKIMTDLNRKEGKTVILVTHDNSLSKIADRRVQMLDGKITKITKLRKR